MPKDLFPIELGNLDVKLSLGGLALNVHYVKSGTFHLPMPEHSHSARSYELHYVPSGRGTLIAQGERYPLGPGSLYMTGPLVAHEQLPDPLDPMSEYCVFCEVLRPDAPRGAPEPAAESDDAELVRRLLTTPFWIGQDRAGLLELFRLISKEAEARELGYPGNVARLLEMVLVRTLRQYEDAEPSSRPLPTRTLDDSRLLAIENAFLFRFRDVTLTSLADELGLSPRQTERAVRKQYGLSFNAKKTEARMSAAARLLSSTDLPVAAVSERLGFATPESFAGAFKRYYRSTPTKYRTRHRRE